MKPITLVEFPEAIVHFDGDAFFTSVEQSMHPELKGRPVVTGKERGIIACASYEAKALGIKRGVALHDARRQCPELVVLPSDYETYSLYSKRMFDIVRRITPLVEEYSIDEGFADLAGLRRIYRTSYKGMAATIQQQIQRELDITVSVGLSLSKSLAKLASDFRKPNGLTAVAGYHIHLLLARTPLEEVWGFGPNTVKLLRKYGLRNALDYINRPEVWASRLLGKPGRDIWHELRGNQAFELTTELKTDLASISKCKTFTAPSFDRDFIYAKLVRNVESAFIKLRRHRLRTRSLTVVLRAQNYDQRGLCVKLNRSTSATQEAMPVVRALFDQLHQAGVEYRATMVCLEKLETDRFEQLDLFEDRLRIEKLCMVARVADEINARFGKHKLSLGPSLFLPRCRETDRDQQPWRKTNLLKGENARQRLNIPRLGIKV